MLKFDSMSCHVAMSCYVAKCLLGVALGSPTNGSEVQVVSALSRDKDERGVT